MGKEGRGLTEHFGVQGQVEVVMGTLSKALGSVGGYLSGKAVLIESMINHAREFIYTTAPHPAASGAALASLEMIQKKPAILGRLWENIVFLREGLKTMGFDLMGSEGPIIPILIGETARTIHFKDALMKEKIFAPAIRPPTVTKGTDRIRLSVTADHTRDDLNELLRVLKKIK